MSLTLVGTPTSFVAGATSINSAFPTGYSVTAGDAAVLVVLSKHRTEATIPSTAAGWPQLGTALGGVTGSGVDVGRVRCTVFTRELQVGDTAPTVSQASGTGNMLAAFIYVLRRSAAGTYTYTFNSWSEATSTTAWSETLAGVPDWIVGDHLILPVGATTDAVTGFSPGTLTAIGLTVGTITEDIDAGTTQGDDARFGSCHATITAGPPTAAPLRTLNVTGVSTTGIMAAIRVRHEVAAQDATVTPSVVSAVATVGSVLVTAGTNPAPFTTGESLVGGIDALAYGASSDKWVTLLPATVQAKATVPTPMLWGPPSGLTATVLSPNSIRLNWNIVLAADSYDVERNGVVVAQNVLTTQYDDTGLAPETEYTYRVRAVR